MDSINASDYTSSNQAEIFPSDINERIDELSLVIRDTKADGDEPFDEDVAELNALENFRHEVARLTDNHFDEATIVPEDKFAEHARDWAHGISDIDFLDSYVDWDKFARDLRSDRYQVLYLGDDLVYVR